MGWGDIEGVALVHVKPDHFVLYDAENHVFYDPAQLAGPDTDSDCLPISYLTVQPPNPL